MTGKEANGTMATTELYQTALAEFAQHGRRYAALPMLTAYGKAAGLTADEIIADAHGVGVFGRDADIRRLFDGSTATPRGAGRPASLRRFTRLPPAKPKPDYKPDPDFVRYLIAWGKEAGTAEALMDVSPVKVAGLHGLDAARALLDAMFKPSDLVLVGTATRGFSERNLRPARDWLTDPTLTGWEQVKINPFTGKDAPGGARGKTRIGRKCLSRYALMLMEFDGLSYEDQYKFWSGYISWDNGLAPLVALVDSGRKSIHGLIRIGARDAAEWQERCEQAKALFCSDPDPKCRVDIQALEPDKAVRLAGARRGETGRDQRLLYLDPDAGLRQRAAGTPEPAQDTTAKQTPPPIDARMPLECTGAKDGKLYGRETQSDSRGILTPMAGFPGGRARQ